MPDVLSSDDLNILAAEYVLGTLDYEERKGASALLEVDPAFRQVVAIWEKRFGDLHLMVESVQPAPALWERIRPKIADTVQIPLAIPPEPRVTSSFESVARAEPGATPPEPAPIGAEVTAAGTDAPAPPSGESEPTASAEAAEAAASAEPTQETTGQTEPAGETKPVEPAEDTEPTAEPEALAPADAMPAQPPAQPMPQVFVPPLPMVRRSAPSAPAPRSGRGWRAASVLLGVVALLLAGLITAWRFFPERLPGPLRAYSVLNMPLPPPPAPPEPPPAPRPKPPAPFHE
jgi:hypothetical protein